jgi:hypothetical protein
MNLNIFIVGWTAGWIASAAVIWSTLFVLKKLYRH